MAKYLGAISAAGLDLTQALALTDMGLNLCKRYGPERLEAACRQAVSTRVYQYQSVKSILKTGLDKLPQSNQQIERRLPKHDNVRGSGYYH